MKIIHSISQLRLIPKIALLLLEIIAVIMIAIFLVYDDSDSIILVPISLAIILFFIFPAFFYNYNFDSRHIKRFNKYLGLRSVAIELFLVVLFLAVLLGWKAPDIDGVDDLLFVFLLCIIPFMAFNNLVIGIDYIVTKVRNSKKS